MQLLKANKKLWERIFLGVVTLGVREIFVKSILGMCE